MSKGNSFGGNTFDKNTMGKLQEKQSCTWSGLRPQGFNVRKRMGEQKGKLSVFLSFPPFTWEELEGVCSRREWG